MTAEQKQHAATLASVLRGVLDAASSHLDDHLLIGALVAQAADRSGRLAVPLTDETVLALWHEGQAAVTMRNAGRS